MKKKLKQKFLETLNAPDQKTVLKNEIGVIRDGDKPKVPFYKKLVSTRKRLVISLSSVLATSLILIIGSIMLVNYRNTPVYKGMYISNASNQMLSMSAETRDASELEDLIENEIDVTFHEGISYYAKKAETILVTVEIENPNFYEILSFTLNGRLYQSFEFQEGSNSNQIIVKFETSNLSGIQTITIDAIKYVDDTTIKNARFNGSKTIQVAVLYESAPEVSDIVKMIDTTTFGVSFVAKDTDRLIDIENSGLMLFLFDGDTLVERSKLNLGRNVMPYSNLKMAHIYDYAIVGVFDLLDGAGRKAYILHYETFVTNEAFEFEINEVSYDFVEFEFNRLDLVNGVLMKVELLLDDNVVDTITPSEETLIFDNIDSDKTYQMVLTYRYVRNVNGLDIAIEKTIETSFTTPVRPSPTFTFKDVISSKVDVTFDYDIIDTTDLGYIKSISLYMGETLIETSQTAVNTFDELLSNTDYEIVVDYQYDLKDGQGFKTLNSRISFKTEAKVIPSMVETNVNQTQTDITFDYILNDIDDILNVKSIHLLLGDQLVKSITPEETKLFDNLLSNNTYTVEIIYEYDLNDGNGLIEDSYSFAAKTTEKVKPLVTINSAVNFGNIVFVLFSNLDVDKVSTISSVELYKDGILINQVTDNFNLITDSNNEHKSNGDIQFNDLAIGTYIVVIVYEYDLNDGLGTQVVNYENRLENNNYIGVDVK